MRKIVEVKPGVAAEAGVIAGDLLISINGQQVADQIDYRFLQASESVRLRLRRNGREMVIRIHKAPDEEMGIVLEPDRIIRCRNRCSFCFVNNNPRGLRRSLYIRDDDYRLSLLYGNFITLTNLNEADLARIERLRISPLYVSVHATEESLRRVIFGRHRLPPLLPIMRRLADSSIAFHCQIVILPGVNDGQVLEKTIADLVRLRPAVKSVGVVPVGLTKYYRRDRPGIPVRRVTPTLARQVLQVIDQARKRYGVRDTGLVYAADEIFILARTEIPPATYYDDYPQLENGIGMVRRLIDSIPRKLPRQNLGIWVTGVLMSRLWRELIIHRLKREISFVVVPNNLFGSLVTVTGLLAGSDILRELKKVSLRHKIVILPPNCLSEDDRFIDGMTKDQLAQAIGRPVIRGSYDFTETCAFLS